MNYNVRHLEPNWLEITLKIRVDRQKKKKMLKLGQS